MGEATGEKKGRKCKPQALATLSDNNARRARTIIQEGQRLSAAQALISLGMEDALAAVLEMCLENPLADPPRDMEEDPTSGPLQVGT